MPSKTEKPKIIEIVSVRRTRKTIAIAWTQGDASFDLEERDNPLPAFTAALDALAPLVGVICHLPKDYHEENFRVEGFGLGAKSGSQTVFLKARKGVSDAAKEFAITTPERLLTHPTGEGRYTPALADSDRELMEEAIAQAKRYIKGDRAQGQIVFEGEEDGDEDGDGEEHSNVLPLPLGDATAKPAKKKKTKKSTH